MSYKFFSISGGLFCFCVVAKDRFLLSLWSTASKSVNFHSDQFPFCRAGGIYQINVKPTLTCIDCVI